jgi:putative endonuclease
VQKKEKSELGRLGEKIAYNYLVKKGFTIKETNWRFKHKEIDIICMYESTLVIVEVKTRSNPDFERPQDAVTRSKQRLLVSAADAYIQSSDFQGEVRFDIISIVKNKTTEIIEHIPDAFYPLL